MTILDEIKRDHDRVRAILGQIDQLVDTLPEFDEDKAARILRNLKKEIAVHNEAEEDIFYEALKEKDEHSIYPYLGFEEHQIAVSIIGELENGKMDLMERAAKMKALKDIIFEHMDEEESIFFEAAEDLLSKKQLEQLTQDFNAKKASLLK